MLLHVGCSSAPAAFKCDGWLKEKELGQEAGEAGSPYNIEKERKKEMPETQLTRNTGH